MSSTTSAAGAVSAASFFSLEDIRELSLFIGTMSTKYTTAATIRKLIAAVITAPKSTKVSATPGRIWKPSPFTSVLPSEAMSGLMILLVKAVTMFVNAEPMTTATASSITLPRRIKSRKPFNIILISSFESRRQIAVYRLEQSVNVFEVPTRKSLRPIPRNYNCQRL